MELRATSVNTVDGLVNAISSWPGFQTSAPQSITVGGHPGKLVEVAATVTAAHCASPVLWTMSGGGILDGYPIVNDQPKQFVEQFRIVDIGNRPFVIRTTDFGGPSPYEIGQGVARDPLRHQTDQATLHGMINSIAVSDTTAP